MSDVPDEEKDFKNLPFVEKKKIGEQFFEEESAGFWLNTWDCAGATEGWVSVWNTCAKDMMRFGAGIHLYFCFVKGLSYVMWLCVLITLPYVVLCLHGDALNKSLDDDAANEVAEKLARTTLANVGNWINESIRQGSGNTQAKGVLVSSGILDALAVLLVFCYSVAFEIFVKIALEEHRKRMVAPETFAVYVDCLPKKLIHGMHPNYQEVLRNHFENLLTARVPEHSSIKGMHVVNASDLGSERKVERICNSRCLPVRYNGADLKGRKVGQVIAYTKPTKTNDAKAKVRWHRQTGLESPIPQEETEWICVNLRQAHLLSNLERDGCDPKDHFSGEPLVFSCSLIRDFGDKVTEIKAHMNAYLREQQRQKAKNARESQSSKRYKINADKIAGLVIHIPTSPRYLRPRRECDCLGAFVTFSRVRHCEFVANSYRFSGYPILRWLQPSRLKFHGYQIRVVSAISPSDIFWENMDFPPVQRHLRQWCVAFACLTLLAGVIAFFSAEKRINLEYAECQKNPEKCSNNDPIERRAVAASASVAVVTVQFLLRLVVNKLVEYIRPASTTQKFFAEMNIASVMQGVNLFVITMIVNADFKMGKDGIFKLFGNGKYSDMNSDWFARVGGGMIFTLLVNSFTAPMMSTVLWGMDVVKRRLLTSRQDTIDNLKTLWTPRDFPIAEEHAELISMSFATLMFASGMPLLWTAYAISVSLFYWCDKWLFLRGCKRPPRFTHMLAQSASQWLQIAAFCHCVIAAWVFGSDDTAILAADNLRHNGIVRIDTDGWNPEWRVGIDAINEFLRRAQTAGAVPDVIVGCFILSVWMIRAVLFIIGRGVIKPLKEGIGMGRQELLIAGKNKTKRRKQMEQPGAIASARKSRITIASKKTVGTNGECREFASGKIQNTEATEATGTPKTSKWTVLQALSSLTTAKGEGDSVGRQTTLLDDAFGEGPLEFMQARRICNSYSLADLPEYKFLLDKSDRQSSRVRFDPLQPDRGSRASLQSDSSLFNACRSSYRFSKNSVTMNQLASLRSVGSWPASKESDQNAEIIIHVPSNDASMTKKEEQIHAAMDLLKKYRMGRVTVKRGSNESHLSNGSGSSGGLKKSPAKGKKNVLFNVAATSESEKSSKQPLASPASRPVEME